MFPLIIFPIALLPSLLWLFYYLRKDVHPEPNRLIMKVFLWGMMATLGAALCIIGITRLYGLFLSWGFDFKSFVPPILLLPLAIIFLNALWEEVLKYLVVRFAILKNPEFDEPVDAMEYMIIAGLAFAAVENVLISANYHNLINLGNVLFLRFLGATFIHALSSAIVGFFLARAIFWRKNRVRYPLNVAFVVLGLLIASGLHGLFNFFIIRSENLQNYIYLWLVAGLLVILALVITRAFRRLNYQSLRKKRRQ